MNRCESCTAKILPGQAKCPSCGQEIAHAEPRDSLIGQSIDGKYEILERLGEGAMGRVYRARQTSLDKVIAIKVLHEHVANDPKVTRRFHREARTASRLSHPNSIEVFDFGEAEDGVLYITMELLDGDDLLVVLEEDGPLSPRRIGRLMTQVLGALQAAHDAGIVHRDLKPENVLVLEDKEGTERVKVCDFGIAKIIEQEGGSAITVTGFVCGTPEFMAPEQARGETIDKRADIYAAGCMLYQMLTGSVPFTAHSALGIITKHLTQPVEPPRERKPEWKIPRVMEEVCLRAMEKDREKRYSSAREMDDALQASIRELGETADATLGTREDPTSEVPLPALDEPRHKSRVTWWALGLGLVGALAIGAALISEGSGGAVGTNTDPSNGQPDASVVTGVTPTELDAGANPTDGSVGDALSETEPDAGSDTPTPPAPDRPPRPSPPRPDDRSGVAMNRMDTLNTPVEPEAPSGEPYAVGRAHFQASEYRQALAAFQRALLANPGRASIHRELGRTYMRIGDQGQAFTHYRRYLELAPDAPDRAIYERMLGQ